MYVRDDLKLVWIRVPKTASTTLDFAVQRGPKWSHSPYDHGMGGHVMIREIPVELKKKYSSYRWYFMVREPVEWIRSMYSWLARNSEHMKDKCLGQGEVPHRWPEFITTLKVTPYSWVDDPDEIIKAIPLKLEVPSVIERVFEVSMAERSNVTLRFRREFEPTKDELDLIKTKFWRELRHYELPGTSDRPDVD